MFLPFLSRGRRSAKVGPGRRRRRREANVRTLDVPTPDFNVVNPYSAAIGSTDSIDPTSKSYTVGVYYPYWACNVNQPQDTIPFDILTHVYYTHIGLNADGSLYLPVPELGDGDGNQLTADECIKKVKSSRDDQNSSVKLILSVGSGDGSANFSTVADDSDRLETFAESLKTLIDHYGYDGADIDWETPESTTDGNSYLQLIKAVRQSLPSSNYTLSAAYTATDVALDEIDVTAVISELDQFHLMSYDFYGSWVKDSGYHSQLFSPTVDADSAANGLSRCLNSSEVDTDKIIIGIPLYAQGFPDVTGPNEEWNTKDMPDDGIQVRYTDLGISPFDSKIVYNETVVAASYYNDSTNIWYSFDNYNSTAAKVDYVLDNLLGGVFFWQITGDMSESSGGSLVSLASSYLGVS
ncbi:glycoside hydrolase [Lipomyces oligophaga]|uniref:glycoside hydrolase n=1 Tax=Lipomyces oligophaga TaxID=45792 RepID=UPI0034CEC34A